jgi:hypothetical protein
VPVPGGGQHASFAPGRAGDRHRLFAVDTRRREWSAWTNSRWDLPWSFGARTLDRIGGSKRSRIISPMITNSAIASTGWEKNACSARLSSPTHLGGGWGDVWSHQVRWARTIRVSKFWGYLGLPVTFATVWAVAAALGGHWLIGSIGASRARMLMATAAGWFRAPKRGRAAAVAVDPRAATCSERQCGSRGYSANRGLDGVKF